MQRGLGWRFTCPPPTLKNLPKRGASSPQLNKILRELREKKVIEIAIRKPMHLARLKIVPKPNGDFRLILDVSKLNKFIKPLSYKLPKLSDLRAILPENAWLAKLDLKDAYHHIPIRKEFRPYLSFMWGSKVYWFRALPFGLSIAPAAFTGMMNPVHAAMRERGISAIAYLDDWLFWSHSRKECSKAIDQATSIFESMGWLINFEKSQITPSQRLVWLGVEWDSTSLMMRLPEGKCSELKDKAISCLESEASSRRQIESLLGSMAFLAQFHEEAAFRKKCFSPILSEWPRNCSRDERIGLSESSKEPLNWWCGQANLEEWWPIRKPEASEWIWADASTHGWGGHNVEGNWRVGRWSEEEALLHINVLEIKAIHECVKASLIQDHSSVVAFTDNITALFAINKMGSSRSR